MPDSGGQVHIDKAVPSRPSPHGWPLRRSCSAFLLWELPSEVPLIAGKTWPLTRKACHGAGGTELSDFKVNLALLTFEIEHLCFETVYEKFSEYWPANTDTKKFWGQSVQITGIRTIELHSNKIWHQSFRLLNSPVAILPWLGPFPRQKSTGFWNKGSVVESSHCCSATVRT